MLTQQVVQMPRKHKFQGKSQKTISKSFCSANHSLIAFSEDGRQEYVCVHSPPYILLMHKKVLLLSLKYSVTIISKPVKMSSRGLEYITIRVMEKRRKDFLCASVLGCTLFSSEKTKLEYLGKSQFFSHFRTLLVNSVN